MIVDIDGKCDWFPCQEVNWSTSCDNDLYNIKKDDYKYCPYCGKEIKHYGGN